MIFVVCQTAPLYDRYNDDDDDDYLSHKLNVESTSEELNQKFVNKRDALWTTTEVLDCVRRLKHYQNSSKLDRITEMLNCYRRLKHSG